ncbi:hypothetical protein EV361DRAFT_585476 [Lentinula raphanica]|nr:hypothetical protein EV361DRAFT_585476 [Lentinula raphanica]
MDESLIITARFQIDTTVLAQSPISPRKECSRIMYNNICMTSAEFNSTGCYMKWCYTTSSNLCPFTTWHAQVVERLNSVELLSSSMSRIEITMKTSCSGLTFISESTSHHLLVPHSTTFPVRLTILKMCQKYRQGGGPIEVPVTSFLNFPLTRRHLQTGIAYSTWPHGITTSGNIIQSRIYFAPAAFLLYSPPMGSKLGGRHLVPSCSTSISKAELLRRQFTSMSTQIFDCF